MSALGATARAILMSTDATQLQVIIRRLSIVADTASNWTERGIARDLVAALKERND